MYELYKSNEQDESLLLLEDNMSKTEAMKALKDCEEEHCQIEYWNTPSTEYKNGDIIPSYSYAFPNNLQCSLIATKHNGKITKYY